MTKYICYSCGKEMHASSEGSYYIVNDKFLGTFTVRCASDDYHFCDCGEEILHYNLCKRIEEKEQELVNKAILNRIGGDLSKIGIIAYRKSALLHLLKEKELDPRYNTLVWKYIDKDEAWYLKDSVGLFLRTGDGRYSLKKWLKLKEPGRDILKRMSNKELAEWLTAHKCECPEGGYWCNDESSVKNWIKWLDKGN